MTSIPDTGSSGSAAALAQTMLVTLILTAAADRILFEAPVGLSLLLFAALTGGSALAVHYLAVNGRRLLIAGGIYLAALAPLAENVSPLSVMVGLTLFAIASLLLADELVGGLFARLWRFALFFLSMPFAAPAGVLGWRRAVRDAGRQVISFAAVGVWLMPLAAGLIFLALFEEANPVIALWLGRIDFWAIFNVLNPQRLLFLAFIFAAAWPFVRPIKHRAKLAKPAAAEVAGTTTDDGSLRTVADVLFGKQAILRALVVFNLLFGLQTMLDLAYLTGGLSLPDGMTYASYAHRGAYPLVATALLAALFVLLALRSGSQARASAVIRSLVYLWVGQNIALVLSSILRLDLYVDAYGLTYWRVAAFLWMGLVACGLGLIVWRLVAGKSAEWLVGVNLALAGAVLYGACFINFAALISSFNSGHGMRDYGYIADLGPQAIPAVDAALAADPALSGRVIFQYRDHDGTGGGSLGQWREEEARRFSDEFSDWRAWTLRGWRLSRYLRDQPSNAPLGGNYRRGQ